MNVPTIIYWDPKFWELRDDATPYFDDLRRVGVFHDSAESAALHFERIWDDVDSWWSSTEVGEVLSRFKYRYCRAVPDIARCVETVLRTTIATAMDEE
jgi:putative transferase (TIGR04331 family)